MELSQEGAEAGGEEQPFPLLDGLTQNYAQDVDASQPASPSPSEQDGGAEGEKSRLAEEKDPNATVAIFDNFKAELPVGTTHGELTEGVVQEVAGLGEEDTQRYEINAEMSQSFEKALANEDEKALERLVEEQATSMMDNTSAAMEEILNDESSQITTINQSQSIGPAPVASKVLSRAIPPKDEHGNPKAEADLEYRADLARSVGLAEDASDEELARAVVDQVNQTFQNSDQIKDSKQRYDEVSQQAADAGISHVLASGNYGEMAPYFEELGVETGDDFYKSMLLNDNKTVVAATNSQNTGTYADDTGAELNSPNAGAELAAPGENRTMTTQDGATATSSGTSYAAPEVAAVMAQIKAENPELTPQQIEDLLVQTAVPINAPASDVGAGALNADAARAAA